MLEKDATFAEGFFREAYKAELDRKDKILSSLTVISAPVALLLAGAGYVLNKLIALDTYSVYLLYCIVISLFSIGTIFLFLTILFIFQHIVSKPYAYISLPSQFLADIRQLEQHYDEIKGGAADGDLSSDLRAILVEEYAKAATHNTAVNEGRLKKRAWAFRALLVSTFTFGLCILALAVNDAILTSQVPNGKAASSELKFPGAEAGAYLGAQPDSNAQASPSGAAPSN